MHAIHGDHAGLPRCSDTVARRGTSALPVLAELHSGLQHIRIVRHPAFGGQLYLDGDLQISESDTAYGVAMTSPLLGMERLERVAILGGGDGGVLQELLRSLEPLGKLPRELYLIEMDAQVIRLSREHLPAVCGDAFDSPNVRVITGDAFDWIAQAHDLDAVIYDLTMDPLREGQSRSAFITGIIAGIGQALRPGGLLSMQCCGHGLHDPRDRSLRREVLPLIHVAIDRHFAGRCEQDVLIPSYRDLWTFLSARKAG
ncbi:spermine synthase [Arenimonas fontis]|uniref:Spermine synthase n=1 Tax=Arenimonas fontis TaxID=2608255 RepID=A0A5B2ZEV5_9GAMM|nr:spermine synthase [Arenimonas fontis]KAA2285730.1 spermine synthase [Arenimonas fontis]